MGADVNCLIVFVVYCFHLKLFFVENYDEKYRDANNRTNFMRMCILLLHGENKI